jgi:nitrogen regulatory protein P-II 1
MKKLEAIIKPEQLDALKTALASQGFVGMTVYPVRGHGTSGGLTLEWRAGHYHVDFLNRLMVMMVVPEDRYRQAIDCILSVCRQQPEDPHGGMGKIFVSTVDEVIRIRTGKTNQAAL